MKVEVKKYNGDANRAYKALMRKLNRDRWYEDMNKNVFFISKGKKNRKKRLLYKYSAAQGLKNKEAQLIKEDEASFYKKQRNKTK